jgi:hypothetical protein
MLEQRIASPMVWPDYTDSAPELLTLVRGFLESAHSEHKVHRGAPVIRGSKGEHRRISCDVVFSQMRYRPDRYNAIRFDLSFYIGHGVYGTLGTIGLISALRQDLLKHVSAAVDQSRLTVRATGFEATLEDGSISVESEMKSGGAVLKTHLWVRASVLDPTLCPAYSFNS